MYSCGMYDFSGEWACTVGVPAKCELSITVVDVVRTIQHECACVCVSVAGVGGAIYLVIPSRCGVCVRAPPLDQHGNSVRSIEFCKRLVDRLQWSVLDVLFTGHANRLWTTPASIRLKTSLYSIVQQQQQQQNQKCTKSIIYCLLFVGDGALKRVNEPLHGVDSRHFVVDTHARALGAAARDTMASTRHHHVKVHTVNTDRWIVFNAQINVLINTKTKVSLLIFITFNLWKEKKKTIFFFFTVLLKFLAFNSNSLTRKAWLFLKKRKENKYYFQFKKE